MADESLFRLIALSACPLALWADWNYRRLGRLPRAIPDRPLPFLSIIVPARNEAINLRRLLPSLAEIRYPGRWEVLVMDDNSTDGTANEADRHMVQLIRLAGPPPGWLGKPYACHQGAAAAQGEWLLFTDADTVHAADGPALAVGYACQHGLDGLSLWIKGHNGSLLARISLLVGFAGLFTGLSSGDDLFNGQYILLHRDTYDQSGGFRSVAGEPLEDLALGRRLRSLGFRVPMLHSEHAAHFRVYEDIPALWGGMTRLTAGSLPGLHLGSWIMAFFVGATVTPLLLAVWSLKEGRSARRTAAAWVAVAAGYLPWARRSGAIWTVALAPLGAAFVLLSAAWGLMRRLFGRGYVWKDRTVSYQRRGMVPG